MASQLTFAEAVENRRSIYGLTSDIPISDARVEQLAVDAIKHVPSSFNSQSTRLVVLLNADHKKFWEAVKECLKPQVPADQFAKTAQKMDMFGAAKGTVLFYEDPNPVKQLQSTYPLYAHHFPTWAEHTNAMHQFALWTALEAEGCGANLQHYNPVVNQKAAHEWNIPQDWDLRAQLVFGGIPEGAEARGTGPKEFKPIEERVFVHGKQN